VWLFHRLWAWTLHLSLQLWNLSISTLCCTNLEEPLLINTVNPDGRRHDVLGDTRIVRRLTMFPCQTNCYGWAHLIAYTKFYDSKWDSDNNLQSSGTWVLMMKNVISRYLLHSWEYDKQHQKQEASIHATCMNTHWHCMFLGTPKHLGLEVAEPPQGFPHRFNGKNVCTLWGTHACS
jgi:hypothetical protein